MDFNGSATTVRGEKQIAMNPESTSELPELTTDELTRYSRHILLPEVGMEGQQKLKAARVLCVGAGGLGSPLALYLAAAGIGTLGLVDFDQVDVSNLQRQILQSTADVGRKKVQTLVCEEISSRGFDKVNEEALQIMESVRKKAGEYFGSVGVTLDFIGWADTFTFDASVQKAVNDHYAAEKLKDVMPVLQALNQLKVQEGLGAGLASKGPPVVVTPDMINALINLTAQKPAPAR